MKHALPITLILIGLFVVSQLVGLGLLAYDANVDVTDEGIVVTHDDTALGERPPIEGGEATVYIISAILIGTLLLLGIIKFGKLKLWKAWYFIAVWAALSIALGVIMPALFAMLSGLIIAWAKIYRPNMILHNFSEIFMYAGIGILFVPLVDPFWMIVILLLISVYDVFAVWKSKHMVAMAKFTMKSEVFAGLSVPYKKVKKAVKPVATGSGTRMAILGGGDIAFPLLFAGTVLEMLLEQGATKIMAYFQSLIIVVFATIALSYLFFHGEKGKFYPAMPPLTLGCLIGYGIILLF